MKNPTKLFAATVRLACCVLCSVAAACSATSSTPRAAGNVAQNRALAVRTFPQPSALYAGRPELAPAVRPLPVMTAARPRRFTSGNAFAYVSDYGQNTVTAFSAAGVQTAQITSAENILSPQGLATDTQGNVYIANTGAPPSTGYVTVWSPGLGQMLAMYFDYVPHGYAYYPADVAVDDAAGLIGITNLVDQNGGPGSAMIYAKGASSPCVTLTDPAWSNMYFGAFDDAGNFYIDGRSPSGTTLVGVVTGGCSATSITTLTGAKIAFPGGIAVAPNDDVVIDDQGTNTGSTVLRYAPPVNGAFAKPLRKTPLTGSFDAAGIALTASGRDLWYADTNVLTNSDTLDEIAYPKGGAPLQRLAPTPISNGAFQQNVIGAAVAPGALP